KKGAGWNSPSDASGEDKGEDRRKYTTRHGTTAEMDVSNIGKKGDDGAPAGDAAHQAGTTTREADAVARPPVDAGTADGHADDAGPQEVDVMRDALGVPVPPELLETFEALEDFDRVRSLLREAQQIVHRLGRRKGGEEYHGYLRLVGYEDKGRLLSPQIRQALEYLNWSRPYACTYPSCHHAHPGNVEPTCLGCI